MQEHSLEKYVYRAPQDGVLLYHDSEEEALKWGSTKIGTIRVYDDVQLAIDKGWESLYFADNASILAELDIEDTVIALTTSGNVLITPEDGSYELTNEDKYAIRKRIDNGTLYESEIQNNNWFEVYHGVYVEHNRVYIGAHKIFEETPSTLEEVAECMVRYAAYFLGDQSY